MDSITWEKYRLSFSQLALDNKFSDNDIAEWLSYANKLVDNNLPIIYDASHFSELVGYDIEYVMGASHAQQLYYRRFNIAKRSGKLRAINEPLPSLKEIQSWILENILEKIPVSEYSKAYRKNTSIKDNAKYHRGQPMVLNIDIEGFFDNISFIKVYNLFKRSNYSKAVSNLLAQLCVLNNSLPQGAPTSPIISNLIFKPLDSRIAGLCKKYKIRYSRYADDMSFSGEFSPGMIIKFVGSILTENGFRLNSDKTKSMQQNNRQMVTGIVVNERLQVPLQKRKSLRQAMYYINRFGFDSHMAKIQNSRANYLKHLLGVCNFILFINPKDFEFVEYRRVLYEIMRNDDSLDKQIIMPVN